MGKGQAYLKNEERMKHILVVDDDVMITGLLSEYLRKNGYQVTIACNGKEALERIKDETPNLILLDLAMPVMDGIEAMREIRKQFKSANLPIIVLSAESDKKMWARALDVGANDFIQKPFHKIEMLARIRTNLKIGDLTNKLAIRTLDLMNEQQFAIKMQETVLLQEFSFEGLEIELFCHPSQKISGGFYDCFKLEHSVSFIIGHVPGNELSSALIMFAARALLHAHAQTRKQPLAIMNIMDKLFCEMFKNTEFFLSLVFAVFDEDKEELSIVSAGHNPVFVCTGEKIQAVESTGLPLGLGIDTLLTVSRTSFQPGAWLFICTESLIEIQNSQGKQFGIDGLTAALQKDLVPKKQVQNVFQQVSVFCNKEYAKEITMLAVERK